MSAPLNVGFVSWRDLPHPQAGGSELVVDRYARGLQERGHRVRLMCGGPVGRHHYPVDDLGGPYAQYLRAPLVHARRYRHTDVLVDVQNGIPFYSPLWRARPVVCLVHHVHAEQWALRFGPPVAALGRTLEGRGMPLAYRRARFVAVSPSTSRALQDLGVPADRIDVVTSGVDEDGHAPPGRSDEPLFLALGRLVPHKRIDLLLDLWREVREVVGGRLVIAGDGPELPRLRRRAPPGVELCGHVSEARKRELLSAAWLLVHPALHEGWGVVVLEAAAVGTPAIAFDVPGVRDAIQPGCSGELAADPAAFARLWVELADSPERRARMGAAARAWAATQDWTTSVRGFEAVLLRAAGR